MLQLNQLVADSDISSCCLGNSGRIIATADTKYINIWATGKPSPLLQLNSKLPSTGLAIDSQELLLANSSFNLTKIWDLELQSTVRSVNHPNATNIHFHPFGDFFISATEDIVKIWDLRRKGCIQTYPTRGLSTMNITPDGRWIATGHENGTVNIWDMTAGKLINSSTLSNGKNVKNLIFSPTDVIMSTVTENGTLCLTDLNNFEVITKTNLQSCKDKQQSGIPKMSTFDPDGTTLAVALADGFQTFSWCRSTKSVISQDIIPSQWNDVCDIGIISEDSRLIAVSSSHNFLNIWGLNLNALKAFQNTENNGASELQQSLPKISKTAPSLIEVLKESPPLVEHTPKVTSNSTKPLPKIRPRKQSEEKLEGKHSVDNKHRRKFSSQAPQSENIPIPTTSSGVLDLLKSSKSNTSQLMANRLSSLRVIKQAWDDGMHDNTSVKCALIQMQGEGDPAVWIDFLRILNTAPKLASTLEVCLLLLGFLNQALYSEKIEYVEVCCLTVRNLVKSFGGIVARGVQKSNTVGVDLVREERRERCFDALDGFKEVKEALEGMGRVSGSCGVVIRDTLSELKVFDGVS